MNKKLFLVLCLIVGKAMAMDAELSVRDQQAQPNDSPESIGIITQDQERRELPARLVTLSGTLNNLREDLQGSYEEEGISLPQVSLATWQHIETQLERVYSYTQGDIQSKDEIIAQYRQLDCRSLIDLLNAVDYLDIPLLREITLTLAQNNLNPDDIVKLHSHTRNELVNREILEKLGLVRLKELGRISRYSWFDRLISDPKKLRKIHSHRILKVVCVTNDNKIVTGSEDAIVQIWDAAGNQLVASRGLEIDGWDPWDLPIYFLCISPDNKIVVGSIRVIAVLDMTGKQLAVWEEPKYREDPKKNKYDSIGSLCVTRDNKIVAGHYGEVRIWDMSGNQVAIFTDFNIINRYSINGYSRGSVNLLRVTYDNKIIAGDRNAGYICMWDRDGNRLAIFSVGYSLKICLTTHDSKIVAVGSDEETMQIWDTAGNQLAVCKHTKEVTSVCITHDNKIVSGSDDGVVRIWDTAGNQLAVCGRPKIGSGIKSVCVTPDNKIISGSWNGKVRVWDMVGNKLAGVKVDRLCDAVYVTPDNKIVSFKDHCYDPEEVPLRIWDGSLIDHLSDMTSGQAQAIYRILRQPLKEDESKDGWEERCWQEIWGVFEERWNSAKRLQAMVLVSVPIFIALRYLRS